MLNCLLLALQPQVSIHLQLSVRPVPLHVQLLLLAGWLLLHPPGLPHVPACVLKQERVAQPAPREQILQACHADTHLITMASVLSRWNPLTDLMLSTTRLVWDWGGTMLRYFTIRISKEEAATAMIKADTIE
jgi:hypothetical protein